MGVSALPPPRGDRSARREPPGSAGTLGRPRRASLRTGLALAALLALGAAHAAQSPPAPSSAPFEAVPLPAAPDYARPSAWARRPGDVSHAGAVRGTAPAADPPADAFYVHPTTYPGPAWNADVGDATLNAATDAGVIARQASAFDACCRVYAPRYRQASAAALFAPPALHAGRAYALAYDDVRDAFRYYLDHLNRGRPLVLAGHSQGTLHVLELLREFGADPRVRERLVVAYAIGIAVPVAAPAGWAAPLPVCARPAAVGCLVSWNTFAADGDARPMIARALDRYRAQTGRHAVPPEIVCVNPLTFDGARPDAAAHASLGALPGPAALAPRAALPPRIPGAVAARCRDGILYVQVARPAGLALRRLDGGGLHFNDYDLFYEDLRRNARARVDAYRARRVE